MRFLLLLLFSYVPSLAVADCDIDYEKFLAMDFSSFDQSMEGWRSITADDNCFIEAADLLSAYQEQHGEDIRIQFHEAQLRAFGEQSAEAATLIEGTFISDDEDLMGTNIYKRATIAFLRNDRELFLKNMEELRVLPRPQELKITDHNGNPVNIPWPVNFRVVEKFDRCWGESYLTAYRYCNNG